MTENDTTRGDEHESDVQQASNGEWHERKDVQVTILSDDGEGSRSPGHLKVLEPEGDDKSSVALAIESQSRNCDVRLDVNPALLFADELKMVAEQVLYRGDEDR
jgi:hypothetical protein